MGREEDSESEFLSRSHLNLGPHFPDLYIGTFEGYVAFFFLIKVYLIYNVVLVSGKQRSDSVIQILMHIYKYICVYIWYPALIF